MKITKENLKELLNVVRELRWEQKY
jgi:hypothetical protein